MDVALMCRHERAGGCGTDALCAWEGDGACLKVTCLLGAHPHLKICAAGELHVHVQGPRKHATYLVVLLPT